MKGSHACRPHSGRSGETTPRQDLKLRLANSQPFELQWKSQVANNRVILKTVLNRVLEFGTRIYWPHKALLLMRAIPLAWLPCHRQNVFTWQHPRRMLFSDEFNFTPFR